MLASLLIQCGRYNVLVYFLDQGLKLPPRLVMQALYDAVKGSPSQAILFTPWLIKTKRLEDFLIYLLWNSHTTLLKRITKEYDVQLSEALLREAGRRNLIL